MIVANDVSRSDSGFGTDTNRATLISADGRTQELPLLTKDDLAGRIMARVEKAWKNA